jgi:hypothetical protein
MILSLFSAAFHLLLLQEATDPAYSGNKGCVLDVFGIVGLYV